MAKTTQLNIADPLTGAEMVPLVQNGELRRGLIGDHVENLTQPFVDAAEQARDITIASGAVFYATKAAGEAATANGEIFAVAEGDGVATYWRKGSPSIELFKLATKALVDGKVGFLDNVADLKSATPNSGETILVEGGRSGRFIFRTAAEYFNDTGRNLVDDVILDTEEGIIIPPASDGSGASGAWLRSSISGTIEALWFGAIGNGVHDDTVALQAAAAIAKVLHLPIKVEPGTYKLTQMIELSTGLAGAGKSETLFQAENAAVKSGALLAIDGGGIYEGFSVDGAVSDDPVAWDGTNYNSFTGWWPISVGGAKGVIFRNIQVQNSAQAGFRVDACYDVIIENCAAVRCRNNFGDGFYITRSTRIRVVNCSAEDVTRIGFVTEGTAGGTIELSSQIAFTNCIAENAHDQSSDYGGGEFNAGFWSENTNIVSFDGCVSRDTGDRGFTYAATALNLTNGFEGAQAGFVNCYAENAGTGFNVSSLAADPMVSANFDACVVNECNIGVAVKRVIARIDELQYVRDGGSNTAMVISADNGAHVTVNNLFTRWTNQGSFPASPTSDSGIISKFSSADPTLIKVSGARTHDNEPITVKHRETSATSEIILEDCNVFLVVVKCKSIQINDCNITSLLGGGVTVTGPSHITNSQFELNEYISLAIGQGGAYYLDNCEAIRNSSSYWLQFFNASNTESRPTFFVSNCRFIGDIEAGTNILRVNGDGALAAQARSHDLWISNSVFVNTGGATPNAAVELTRGVAASDVFATGIWKSSTITNIATRTKAGSVINNFD